MKIGRLHIAVEILKNDFIKFGFFSRRRSSNVMGYFGFFGFELFYRQFTVYWFIDRI